MASVSTNGVLRLFDYFLFWITASEEVRPVSAGARGFAALLDQGGLSLKRLFGLESYSELVSAARNGGKREVTVRLADGRRKTLRWELITLRSGVLCVAVDWERLEDLLEKFRRQSLVFKEILLNILPGYIAEELVEKKAVHPKVYRHSTVMFTDVVCFARLAFHLDPVSLIRRLNSYFSMYDRVMDEFGIEKIKTIGDSYMCVSGIPAKKKSHAVDCCLAALNILRLMKETRQEERPVEGLDLNNWSIRIGVHTGPCISGVVGYKKYTFDIWGDSVNIAARMEEVGEPGRINVSEPTYQEVKDFFDCSLRGSQEVKHIGTVRTYFLDRLARRYAEDPEGLIPNQAFVQAYCSRFRVSADSPGLPHFIRNHLERTQVPAGGRP